MPSLLLLTGGVVENLSLRTPAGAVERLHRHQVCVATPAVIGAVVAGGVAGLHTAAICRDEGRVAVGVRHRVPC